MMRSKGQHTFVWRIALVVILCAAGLGGSGRAAAAVDPGVADGWITYHTDAQITFSNMSQHSLRLDASGNPSVAYGGDHLYYYHRVGTRNYRETADPAWNVGSGAALALDAAGKAHISYYDSANLDLKYATNKTGAWVATTVVSSGDVGRYSEIAIDAWGDPVIVYYKDNAGVADELHYIGYDSEYGAWGNDETIPILNGVYDPYHTGWFSFALDTSVTPNKPHVSFYQSNSSNSSGVLRYASYNTSNAWVTSTLETSCANPCHAGEYNSIALDPVTKYPSAAYSYDGFTDPIIAYRSFNGAGWNQMESAGDGYGKNITLAFGSDRTAFLAYQYNGLIYFSRPYSADMWPVGETIDADVNAGEWASLAVSGTTAKVTHHNPLNGQFLFIDHSGTSWTPVVVATRGHRVGRCTSQAVDAQGRSHTSYYDDTSGSLLYTTGYTANTSSTLYSIPNTTGAACYSVIAINPVTNSPAVGLVIGTTLYYTTLSGGVWTALSTVDTSLGFTYPNELYRYFALAFTSTGTPAFTYVKNGALKYATKPSSWDSVTIPTTGTLSRDVSLAFDSQNYPHILFYADGHPKRAYNKTGWTVDSPAAWSGSYRKAAISVSSTGQVMAAFLDMSLGLMFSQGTCNPSTLACTWSAPVEVDPTCDEYFSLAVDKKGTPHMACMGWTGSNIELHSISPSGAGWLVQAVDTYGSTGRSPALALSPTGKPRIAYYDSSNGDLKFAIQEEKVYLPVIAK
jgi:hypothetical protein